MKTLAIVGASLAGLSAGRAARAQGFTGRLVIISDKPHRPYDRPPLSKDFLLGTVTVEDLALESDTDELEAEWMLLISSAVIEDFYSGEGNVTGLRLAGGRYIPADVVVVGIGAEPNTGWLEGSGPELRGGVVCDAMGRTGVPGIVAVGDCAAWFDHAAGTHRRVEHWTGALERAALAVEALLDADAAPKPAKPHYFWSDQYGVKLQFAGHSAGYDRLEIEVGDVLTHSCLAVYYREDVPVAVLGMNQPRPFTKWRRSLPAPAASAPADLDKAGAWQTVQIGRESVLISRTRKGQIRGFYNIRRHRGVPG